jgi:hypothetical protein
MFFASALELLFRKFGAEIVEAIEQLGCISYAAQVGRLGLLKNIT